MKTLRYSLRPGATLIRTYCTRIAENRVVEAQLTCVHDAICFFVAFSRTDFVSCGFANFFFSASTSAKNVASGFFALDMFHQSLIAFLFSSFPQLQQPQPSGYCGPFRGPPAARTHCLPAPTPHVGQATEDFCPSIGRFVFISCFRRSRASRAAAVVLSSSESRSHLAGSTFS